MILTGYKREAPHMKIITHSNARKVKISIARLLVKAGQHGTPLGI